MGKRYDSEDMLDDILKAMVQDGALNARIAAVEAEKVAKGKGLDPTLKPILDTSYHLQSWSDKILNSSPAIFYGIESVATNDGGPGAAAETPTVFIEVVMVDSGMTNDAAKRILRYTRAIKDLFSEFFEQTPNSARIKIETVRPQSFKLDYDSSEEIKVGGISVVIPLA